MAECWAGIIAAQKACIRLDGITGRQNSWCQSSGVAWEEPLAGAKASTSRYGSSGGLARVDHITLTPRLGGWLLPSSSLAGRGACRGALRRCRSAQSVCSHRDAHRCACGACSSPACHRRASTSSGRRRRHASAIGLPCVQRAAGGTAAGAAAGVLAVVHEDLCKAGVGQQVERSNKRLLLLLARLVLLGRLLLAWLPPSSACTLSNACHGRSGCQLLLGVEWGRLEWRLAQAGEHGGSHHGLQGVLLLPDPLGCWKHGNPCRQRQHRKTRRAAANCAGACLRRCRGCWWLRVPGAGCQCCLRCSRRSDSCGPTPAGGWPRLLHSGRGTHGHGGAIPMGPSRRRRPLGSRAAGGSHSLLRAAWRGWASRRRRRCCTATANLHALPARRESGSASGGGRRQQSIACSGLVVHGVCQGRQPCLDGRHFSLQRRNAAPVRGGVLPAAQQAGCQVPVRNRCH